MTLGLLLRDELSGFYRSKVMLVLWVGLPLLTVLLYLATPDLGGLSVAVFTSVLVGSLGGTLASAMLAVEILTERERKVYDLFVIRPVPRRDLLLAKFGAVYGCVLSAALLALGLGLVADRLVTGRYSGIDFPTLESSVILLVAMLAISSAAGVLIGVVSPSALVAVILVLYGGNQLAAAAVLPVLVKVSNRWFPLLPGVGISVGLLLAAILIFDRAEL